MLTQNPRTSVFFVFWLSLSLSQQVFGTCRGRVFHLTAVVGLAFDVCVFLLSWLGVKYENVSRYRECVKMQPQSRCPGDSIQSIIVVHTLIDRHCDDPITLQNFDMFTKHSHQHLCFRIPVMVDLANGPFIDMPPWVHEIAKKVQLLQHILLKEARVDKVLQILLSIRTRGGLSCRIETQWLNDWRWAFRKIHEITISLESWLLFLVSQPCLARIIVILLSIIVYYPWSQRQRLTLRLHNTDPFTRYLQRKNVETPVGLLH